MTDRVNKCMSELVINTFMDEDATNEIGQTINAFKLDEDTRTKMMLGLYHIFND